MVSIAGALILIGGLRNGDQSQQGFGGLVLLLVLACMIPWD